MKAATAVLYDACVLYPALLRDFLMWLGLSGCFRARWRRTIQDEWKRNVLRNRPGLSRAQLDRVSDLMDKAIPECLVEGYEALIADLHLPDPDDRHVLAAAIHGEASIIVTFNLRDFPREALAPFGIGALHPDDFNSAIFGTGCNCRYLGGATTACAACKPTQRYRPIFGDIAQTRTDKDGRSIDGLPG